MTDFGKRVKNWTLEIERGMNDLHVNASEKVRDSVVWGSDLTGAPGQPVDTSFLRNTWVDGFKFVQKLHARLSTICAYAKAIEDDNPGAYNPAGADQPPEYAAKRKKRQPGQRSEVGGAHSVKMTVAGWKNIVRAAKREVLR